MATPSLELETGSGAITASGEPGKTGRWRGWVIPVAALFAWWFVSRHVVAGHGMMTSPAQVLKCLYTAIDQARSGALWRALSASLARELTGFTLGASLGLVLGALLGVSPFANRLIGPSFNAFKQVSLFAWIPLIFVWFGLGDVAKVVFLSLAALVPVVAHTSDGIRAVSPALLDVARVFRYSKLQTVRYVVLLAALPSIFTGIYLALIYSWLATLGTEYLLVAGSEQFRMDLVVFGVIVIGITGWALNAFARAIQQRWFRDPAA
ncbi:MAG: Alkanesulfonates transport system permease protein [uncultured Caballeronia sp.]|nr:MAG: Alkanesulfonates transport system permease protein [uncultured Caballeronia sp.]